MKWLPHYLDIAYLPGGRDRQGCDCYGLVRLVLAEQRGISLPEFGAVAWRPGCDRAGLARLAKLVDEARAAPEGWEEVDEGQEQPWDVLWLLSSEGLPIHFGLCLGGGRMLHVESATVYPCLESYRARRWGRRLLGRFRHVG